MSALPSPASGSSICRWEPRGISSVATVSAVDRHGHRVGGQRGGRGSPRVMDTARHAPREDAQRGVGVEPAPLWVPHAGLIGMDAGDHLVASVRRNGAQGDHAVVIAGELAVGVRIRPAEGHRSRPRRSRPRRRARGGRRGGGRTAAAPHRWARGRSPGSRKWAWGARSSCTRIPAPGGQVPAGPDGRLQRAARERWSARPAAGRRRRRRPRRPARGPPRPPGTLARRATASLPATAAKATPSTTGRA